MTSYRNEMFLEMEDRDLADPRILNATDVKKLKNATRQSIKNYLYMIFSDIQDSQDISHIEKLMATGNTRWKTYFQDLGIPSANSLDFSGRSCYESATIYTMLVYAMYADVFAHKKYPRLQSVLDFKVNKETANKIIDDVCMSLEQRKSSDLIHNLLILLNRYRYYYN
jgi:hypothetical protein